MTRVAGVVRLKASTDSRNCIHDVAFKRFRRGQGSAFLLETALTPLFGGSNFQLKSD